MRPIVTEARMKNNPFFTKALAILAIIGLLTLALGRIGYLTEERQGRFQEAVQNIEQVQAGRQALLGPVLLRACKEEWDTVETTGKTRITKTNQRDFTAVFTPTELKVQAGVVMEPRYRGLFKVNTYATKANLQARWAPFRVAREQAASRLSCEPATLMIAVSDGRGIREAHVKVNGENLPVASGTRHDQHRHGFHAVLPGEWRDAPGTEVTADVSMELLGTTDLAIAPVADDTQVQLKANWPHPSFGGRFLPVTRDVREDGFTAAWKVSSLASTAGRDFARGAALCRGIASEGSRDDGETLTPAATTSNAAGCIESFGVAFIDPVNPYTLSNRAVKYGLLFIALSFVAVGMVEVLQRLRVHPIQYLLVGCALSIFFLLLLSLSEHLPFGVSYLAASAACVALLTFYGQHLLRGWPRGLVFGAGVGGLYGALYVLLQMEQTALVIGSLLLFAVLTTVMVLTRRVDWYALLRGGVASQTPTE